ncbi:MAG: hypothetical protein IPL32_14500 [Chloracidobacterium sp.]|nr:hypothetical protein [Chloracidobacterium sp.]
MNDKEKAQEGLRLLKEAVLELIRKHPEGIRPNAIKDELDLWSPDKKGKHKDTLLWGIHNLLETDDLVERRNDDTPRRLVWLFPL